MKDVVPAEMAQDVSDTLAAAQDDLALPESQREELERRLQSCRQNPLLVTPWQEVSRRIRIGTSNV